MNWPEQLYHLKAAEAMEQEAYDYFFWKKKKKRKSAPPRKTPAQKAARKEKRQTFWRGLDQRVQRAGGVDGLVGTAANVVNLIKGRRMNPPPADYQVSLGQPAATTDANPPQRSMTGVYLIGGVLVAGLAAYFITKR